MRKFLSGIAALWFVFASATAAADSIRSIQIRGLSQDLEANVRRRLSLGKLLGRELGAERLDYLLLESEREVREALEPFGYFSPDVHVTPPPGGDGILLIVVAPGEPTRVRKSAVAVTGAGMGDP